MNSTTMTVKQYAWRGQVWTQAMSNGAPLDEQEAVSDTGEAVPMKELLFAIFNGAATPTEANAPASEPPESSEIEAGEMDVAGKARAEQKFETAKRLGLTVPTSKEEGLFYDVGTAVMSESWSAERKGFAELPLGSEALPKVAKAIKAEGRENFTFEAWELRMSKSTGKLGNPETKQAWEPTKRALQGFYQRSGIGTVPDHWPQDIKAATINDLMKRFGEELPTELLIDDKPPQAMLRVQTKRNKAFAVVSPTYGQFDGDLVLEALERACPKGARTHVSYDPDAARGKVEIITLQEEKPVVGEVFKTSFTVGWDDTGGGSVWGDGGLWSARCLNLTRIWTNAGTFRMRHMGQVWKLAQTFRKRFDQIAAVIAEFAIGYGQAASEELTNKEKIESHEFMQGIYRSLLERELVPVKGRREEAVAALTMQALADENKAGLTRAGIANGITRYAHKVNQDPWLRDGLERAAGKILWSPRPVKLDYLAKEAA